MIAIGVPGYGELEVRNLVLDFNGTIAKDGALISGVSESIKQLAQMLDIYVITADTFGSVATELKGQPIKIVHMDKNNDERNEKLELVKKLGSDVTIAIGNGSNDEYMLKESRVGICIIGLEGCSTKALQGSDLATHNIKDALELLLNPNRLKATLRY